MYGSPWSGRVYGYRAPYSYGARIYYGDVRLLVQPRDAAVYVDGYYAGIVDNFDGVFQRLTLEVGPHTIELDAPGLEPRFYDIYVDPARTTTIHDDLFR
ncbi:MAG: PEGA domain-containing protein [Acidobacteria bacterium]|nr:PEGA domain-containing protein [Acidobacteriota bacterium]